MDALSGFSTARAAEAIRAIRKLQLVGGGRKVKCENGKVEKAPGLKIGRVEFHCRKKVSVSQVPPPFNIRGIPEIDSNRSRAPRDHRIPELLPEIGASTDFDAEINAN